MWVNTKLCSYPKGVSKGGKRCGMQLLNVFEAVGLELAWNPNGADPFHNRRKCIGKLSPQIEVNRSAGRGRHAMITPPCCLSFKHDNSRHKTCTTNTGEQERRWTTPLQPFVSPDNAGTLGSSCLYIFRSSFAGTPFPSCPSLWCGSSSRILESTSQRPCLPFYSVKGAGGPNIAMSFASIRFILLSISAWSAADSGVVFIGGRNKQWLYTA